ncbi:hypothetical protein B0H17DRAFT_1207156 [Mycena rosella]|uniref:Uncharacterized protein n=1 Tax=Mycena rosella TaxID=1033263 RepID=A0AAD7D3D1_MYCRO|nr:hypothetical protein B0H17DRAFT_1207156 [Mycena rosella]
MSIRNSISHLPSQPVLVAAHPPTQRHGRQCGPTRRPIGTSPRLSFHALRLLSSFWRFYSTFTFYLRPLASKTANSDADPDPPAHPAVSPVDSHPHPRSNRPEASRPSMPHPEVSRPSMLHPEASRRSAPSPSTTTIAFRPPPHPAILRPAQAQAQALARPCLDHTCTHL